ncbi:MAG: flagellar basal body-associated FliL family protein [Candidatus Rifleibacteriota bacterium]
MSSKTKWIVVILVVLVIALAVVGIAYVTTRKAITGPGGAPSEPPEQGEISTSPKMGRFDLGEFIATSRDEELHYIKIRVEIGYIGNLEEELEERKAELRDAITTILMKLNIQRAKEDYIDHFLHKDIETELNRILGKTTSESRIIKVFIPTFLIN